MYLGIIRSINVEVFELKMFGILDRLFVSLNGP